MTVLSVLMTVLSVWVILVGRCVGITVHGLQGRIQGARVVPCPKICDSFYPLNLPLRLRRSSDLLPSPRIISTPLTLPQF